MPEVTVRVIDAYVFYREKSELLFLLLKRNHGKIYEHLWQGVAGKIEDGEKAWQAATRELKEETGLIPAKIFTADHVSTFYEASFDRLNLVPVFGIEVKSKDVVLSKEHSAFEWMTYEEADSRLSWSGQKKGLNAVYRMLSEEDQRMKWSDIKIDKE